MPGLPRIAIVGGGLGGTTAAILLQRAGYACQTFEQAAAFERVGGGLNLAPNSLRVMRELGLLDSLLRVGNEPKFKISRKWDTAEVIYSNDIVALANLYGAPFLSLHRSDLQRVLTNAVHPGTITFNKRLVRIEPTNDSYVIGFADGTAAAADIVIGADGINSRIRETLLGPQRPHYSGVTAYRTVIPAASLDGLALDDYTKWWGEGSSLVSYFVSSSRKEFYVLALNEEPWLGESFAQKPADAAHVRSIFEGYHQTVQKILMNCNEFSCAPILDREPEMLWSRAQIVTLGDACHPMAPYMGQGAGMAIEDAVILVRCLKDHGPANAKAAFEHYAATRFERTSRVQAESAKNEWMRVKTDPSWLYGYDVLTAPLARASASPP